MNIFNFYLFIKSLSLDELVDLINLLNNPLQEELISDKYVFDGISVTTEIIQETELGNYFLHCLKREYSLRYCSKMIEELFQILYNQKCMIRKTKVSFEIEVMLLKNGKSLIVSLSFQPFTNGNEYDDILKYSRPSLMKMSIKYCPNNQIKDFGFTRSDMEGYVKEVNLSNSDDNFH
jgi:hypothetical protein